VAWLATLGTLVLVPVLVYVISYAPWVALGNRWTEDSPAGNTGQTLLDLQKGMYDYHNNLRATHAASSPWWAWPANLKPVWFYQHDFAGGTTGTLYDNGNLVLFWLAIPAVAFAALMAWRRRSLALALVTVMLFALWLPWARIDRATFQYHIFTTLPFSFLALAYFLAELWHGPSRRTWLVARVAAALMIVGPALLWLLRLPLCAVARVDQVSPNSNACMVSLSRSVGLTDLQFVGVLALVFGLVAFGLVAWLGDDAPPQVVERRPLVLSLTLLASVLGIVVAIVGAFLPGVRGFQLPLDATLIALFALVLLSIPAWYVLRARDARRFVVGALVAAVAWFVLWYPNISGLPVPTPLSQLHVVGIPLPTYIYDFQFGVNQDPPGGSLDVVGVAALLMVVTLLVLAAIYATRAWRQARLAEPLFRTPQEAS
jgi:hypothetical protein